MKITIEFEEMMHEKGSYLIISAENTDSPRLRDKNEPDVIKVVFTGKEAIKNGKILETILETILEG